MVREAIPAVEKATGKKFKEPVWARISTRPEMQRALSLELLPQMRILEPQAQGENARMAAERTAQVYGAIVIAKYAWKSGVIHVVPGTLGRMAKALERPELLQRQVIRVIVTHELVHALDHQEYGFFGDFADAKSVADLEIRNALAEGHAQHVTRKVMESAGDVAAFETYEQVILAGPPSLGEGERYLASVMSSSLRFAYLDGRAFFDALEKSGRKTYVEDAFKNPPLKKNTLLKPETFYGGGKEAAFNPAPAFDAAGKDYGEDWSRRTVEVDIGALRAAFGNFIDKEKVDAALKDVLDGQACILNPKDEPQSKFVAFAVLQTRDAAAARRIFDLSIELSKAKDQKLKEGRIRITKAEYAELPTPPGPPAALIRKTTSVQGQEVSAVSVLGTANEYEFEIIMTNEEIDDAQVKAIVERLVAALRQK